MVWIQETPATPCMFITVEGPDSTSSLVSELQGNIMKKKWSIDQDKALFLWGMLLFCTGLGFLVLEYTSHKTPFLLFSMMLDHPFYFWAKWFNYCMQSGTALTGLSENIYCLNIQDYVPSYFSDVLLAWYFSIIVSANSFGSLFHLLVYECFIHSCLAILMV